VKDQRKNKRKTNKKKIIHPILRKSDSCSMKKKRKIEKPKKAILFAEMKPNKKNHNKNHSQKV